MLSTELSLLDQTIPILIHAEHPETPVVSRCDSNFCLICSQRAYRLTLKPSLVQRNSIRYFFLLSLSLHSSRLNFASSHVVHVLQVAYFTLFSVKAQLNICR